MNTSPLLEQLPDIHLPEPVSWWWPPAPGWWLIGLMALVLTVFIFRVLKARYQKNNYRREAALQLELVDKAFKEHNDSQRYLQELMILTRRLVKTAYPGQQWESLPAGQMIERMSGINDELNQEDIVNIESNLYKKPAAEFDELNNQFHSFLKSWIQQHRKLD